MRIWFWSRIWISEGDEGWDFVYIYGRIKVIVILYGICCSYIHYGSGAERHTGAFLTTRRIVSLLESGSERHTGSLLTTRRTASLLGSGSERHTVFILTNGRATCLLDRSGAS